MNTLYKKAILQIICRSQKPIRFHAGALFQINFQTFIKVRTPSINGLLYCVIHVFFESP